MELEDCLSSVENVAETTQSRLDEILTEAAQIQIEDFGSPAGKMAFKFNMAAIFGFLLIIKITKMS
jgi:hypothetical protein